jgi:hypothetical protein
MPFRTSPMFPLLSDFRLWNEFAKDMYCSQNAPSKQFTILCHKERYCRQEEKMLPPTKVSNY